MKILNVMFAKKKGGMEQAFLDYNNALLARNHHVVALIHPGAQIKSQIKSRYKTIYNFSRFDFLAIYRIKKLIRGEKPDCIITHGARAVCLVKAAAGKIPIIAVAHNNNKFKHMLGVNAIIAVNHALAQTLIAAGQPGDKVYIVPNMLNIPHDFKYTKPKQFTVPCIGAIARMSPEKGIDVLIEALHLLKQKGLKFTAKIAGDGPEIAKYKALVLQYNLGAEVEFMGWISDKKNFYSNVDILCVPSRDESFGIVALEGMMHCLPIISTQTKGAIEVVGEVAGSSKALYFTDIENSEMMAQAIEKLATDSEIRNNLSHEGFLRVQSFASQNIVKMIENVILKTCMKKEL